MCFLTVGASVSETFQQFKLLEVSNLDICSAIGGVYKRVATDLNSSKHM